MKRIMEFLLSRNSTIGKDGLLPLKDFAMFRRLVRAGACE
jgi:hypothetical protein